MSLCLLGWGCRVVSGSRPVCRPCRDSLRGPVIGDQSRSRRTRCLAPAPVRVPTDDLVLQPALCAQVETASLIRSLLSFEPFPCTASPRGVAPTQTPVPRPPTEKLTLAFVGAVSPLAELLYGFALLCKQLPQHPAS